MIKFGRIRFLVAEINVEYQDEYEMDKYYEINHPQEQEENMKTAAHMSFDVGSLDHNHSIDECEGDCHKH